MIIGIDIGNSTTVVATINKNLIVQQKNVLFNSVAWSATKVCNMIAAILSHLSTKSLIDIKLIVSSVVPDKLELLVNECKRRYNFRIEIVSASKVNWFRIKYYPKKSLGLDRLCNVIAARELYGCNTIVIDFGTATTFNVINGDGDFIGGLISPGLDTMRKSLIKDTSQLLNFKLQGNYKSISSSTMNNLQAGLLLFNQFGWEGIVQKIMNEQRKEFQIVLTGGMSKIISFRTTVQVFRDSNLLLKGLKIYSNKIFC